MSYLEGPSNKTNEMKSTENLYTDSKGNIRQECHHQNIGVIGSGAFGTSIAINMAHKQKSENSGKKIFLYVRTEYVLIKNDIVYNTNEEAISNLPDWYLDEWKIQNTNYTLPVKLNLTDLLKREEVKGASRFRKDEWFTINLCSFMKTMRFNPLYLNNVEFPDNVIPVCSMEQLLDCESIVFSVPHQFLKDVVEDFRQFIFTSSKIHCLCEISKCRNKHTKSFECLKSSEEVKPHQSQQQKKELYILNTTKGILKDCIYPSKLFDILKTGDKKIFVSVLMGANIAIQIANLLPAETCIAGDSESNTYFKNQFLMTAYTCESKMVKVFELFGAIKNIVALSVGLIDGLEVGSNATAAIFRLAVVDMLKVIRWFSDIEECEMLSIFTSSAGLGDLYVTCKDGRNYKGGYEVSKTLKYKPYNPEDFHLDLLQGPGTLKILKKIMEENKKFVDRWDKLKTFKVVYKFWFEGGSLNELVGLI